MAKLLDGVGFVLIALLLWLPDTSARQLEIDVKADAGHIAQISAQHLASTHSPSGLVLTLSGSTDPRVKQPPLPLHILSLHEMAREVPELGIAQLPFFYPDMKAVHRALDGELGKTLRAAAHSRQWIILAFWDEGMQVMSGNLAYTSARTLQGREFLLLRDDPMAEIELRALDVWSRRARPGNLAQLHTECLVGSRSATLQQLLNEQLSRVHLDLTLTRHRYEGWVVAMRSKAWETLTGEQRTALSAQLNGMLDWQRHRAAEMEAVALSELVKAAMTAHPLSAKTWKSYRAMLPEWEHFLPATLTPESRRGLVTLATAAVGADR